MANSSSNLDLVSSSQASKEITVNALIDAGSPATTYGRRASTSDALTWGYYGGNVTISNGTMSQIANGTVALTASATNYIVAAKSNGVVSVDTVTTNWDDTANYWRLYSVVAGASAVTSYTDMRQFAQFSGVMNIGAMSYQGAWNALTNTPTLASGVGTKGYYYTVSVAGTTNINGIALWSVGDAIVFNGAAWEKLDGSLSDQELGNLIATSGEKITPVNADMVAMMDSAAGNILKKLSWANIIAALSALYVSIGGALGTPSSGTLTNCTGLPVAGGGTGASSFTAGGILVGNGTSAVGVASSAQVVAAIGNTAVANVTNAYQSISGKAISIPADTNIETWADSLPASGIYNINLTVAQGGLPAGWWYLELIRHSNDALGNLFHTVVATALTGASGTTYADTRINTAWGGWVQMVSATSTTTLTNKTITSPTISSPYITTKAGVGINPTSMAVDTALQVVGSGGIGQSIMIGNKEIKLRGDGVAHYSIFANRVAGALTLDATSGGGTLGAASLSKNLLTLIAATGNIGVGTEAPSSKLTVIGEISSSTTIQTGGYLVSTLPAVAVGKKAYVTDALAPSYLTTLVGGGSVVSPAFCNGTTWVSA